jgi:hypothetical protein
MRWLLEIAFDLLQILLPFRAEPIQEKFYDFKPRIHIAAIAASLLFIILGGSCRSSAGGVGLLAWSQSEWLA